MKLLKFLPFMLLTLAAPMITSCGDDEAEIHDEAGDNTPLPVPEEQLGEYNGTLNVTAIMGAPIAADPVKATAVLAQEGVYYTLTLKPFDIHIAQMGQKGTDINVKGDVAIFEIEAVKADDGVKLDKEFTCTVPVIMNGGETLDYEITGTLDCTMKADGELTFKITYAREAFGGMKPEMVWEFSGTKDAN